MQVQPFSSDHKYEISALKNKYPNHSLDEENELYKCKILIVDDVEINILVLVEALRNYTHISVSLDSKLAIKSLSYSLPDIILLDLFMPNINGFDMCHYVKNNAATKNIPIIL